MNKTEYQKYIEKSAPKTREIKTIVTAFVVGGFICVIGEGISDLLRTYLINLEDKDIASLTTIIMIFLGSLLTGIGLYDKIGYYAGAGSILPITGFANSIVSPAIEYNKEGIIYGIMAKMFVISGPVIVSGVTSSVVVGILFYILNICGVTV